MIGGSLSAEQFFCLFAFLAVSSYCQNASVCNFWKMFIWFDGVALLICFLLLQLVLYFAVEDMYFWCGLEISYAVFQIQSNFNSLNTDTSFTIIIWIPFWVPT